MRKLIPLVLGAVILSGCYHATVDLTPASGPMQQGSAAPKTIDIPWAHGFVYGLVAPKPVDTRATCTNGVSKVETKHSFLNMLAGGITWGIYTPMSIKVTCR